MSAGDAGARAWSAAQALIGVRFRLQGRDAATGLDCVGVIIAAYAAVGVRLDCLGDYPLRGVSLAQALARFAALPLRRVEGARRAGDIGLYALPARQLHLALLDEDRLVHADAGMRRVAEAPLMRLPEPDVRWRLMEKG